MTAPAPLPLDPREQLRQQWLAAAATAFDRMFDQPEQEQLATFSQREGRACLLGLDLGAWLLERHLAADPQVRPTDASPPACPKCGRPAGRLTKPAEPLPRRQLTTLTGEVELRREQWRCTTCRVVFFPPGPPPATGDGGLQPPAAPESRPASSEGDLLQGGGGGCAGVGRRRDQCDASATAQ